MKARNRGRRENSHIFSFYQASKKGPSMKAIAVLAAALIILVSGSLSSAATVHSTARHTPTQVVHLLLPSAHGSAIGWHRAVVASEVQSVRALQVATATTTPTTPEPSPTPTQNPSFPDPVTILNNMYQVEGALKTTHFRQIADQQGAVNLHISAVGDATCKGPSLRALVKAAATLTGTQQANKSQFNFIQIGKKMFYKAKSTKNKWKKAKAKNVSPFGFTIDNPLPCPTSSGGSGTGGGDTGTTDEVKDLVNLGPEKVNGVTVWHIHATDVQVDQTGQSSELPLDWYITQDHYLLEKFVLSFEDTASNVKGSLSYVLSKFGTKVTIKAPKVGSTKP